MSCTRLRCDALPNDVVAGVASPLIGWLLLLTISSYILRKVDYKFSRITSWVAQLPIVAKVLPAHPARTISGEVRRATGYHCLLRLYALLVQLLVLLPYVYLLVWMVVAVLEVKEYYDEFRFPVLMGLSVFVLGSVITIGWYGVAHWVRESYRMTAVPRTCFGLCALLLLLLQIGYVFIVIDTYESLYVVMMCYNLVPWLLTGHLNRFIRDPLTFRSVLQLTPENADEMAVSVVQQQQALVLFWMRFWYIVSYVILFLFAVLADLALDHDAGWQIVLAVFVIDVTLMLHDNAGLETDPNIVAALAVLGRLSLFAFGTSRWFLGVSINYAMFSALMMYHLVNQWYPIVDPDEELDELVGGIESALERQAMDAQLYRPEDRLGGGLAAVVNSGVIGAVLKKTGVQSLFRRLGSPWAALIALNFLFGVYVGVAAVASLLNLDMEEELFPPIAITADAHPQYLYGLFTIIFVWGSFLALRAWRTLKVSMLEQGYAHRHAMQAYQERLRIIKQEDQPVEFADVVAELQPERLVNHDFRYTWSVIVSAILFVLITSGASVVLWALTKSNVVLAAGTTTPLLAVLATASYIDFHAKDFRWNDYLTRKRRLKAMHDEIHKICRRTDDRVRDLIETRKIRAATGGSEAELARKTGDVRLSVRASEGDGLDDPKADEEKATGMCSCLFSCCRYIYLRLGAIRDFVMFKHSRSDYRIVFTSAGVAALCFTAGLVLRVADDWYAGWGLGDVLGIIVGTFFLLSKFINSHRFSSVLFLLLFGMLSQFGTYLGQAGAPPLIIVAVFYLYLGVLFLIMGVTLWRDQRWEMTFTVRKYLGVFIFCTLVLTSAALAEVNTAAVYIGGAVAYLVVVFLVFTGIRWSTQHFYLSYRHRVAAAVICVLLTIVVLFVLIVSDFYWFWAFTAFAVLYGVFVAAMTAQDLSESDTRRLFPSRWIFPIYRYDPRSFEGSQGLKQFNRGHKLYFLLCASLMVWGAMCALLVEPAFVGWIFYAAGLLMAWAMFLQLRYARVREFWTAWQNCAKSPLVIDRARQQAIDTELRAATDMFESASDAKAKRAMSSRDTEDEEGILSLLGMPFRSDTRVTDLPSDRPPPGEEHIETEHDEDEDESKRDSVAVEVEEEAADEAAEFDMRHEDEEALNYLEAIRRLWQWEEQSELPVLINKRKLVSRALRRVVAGHHSEESLERQRHIIGLLNEVDEQIRTTYLEQTRMVVKFMVNLIISAASLRNKRRQVLKDFFRALKTKAFGAASHLADMSPVQMKAWLKEDPENHGAELEAAKRRFVEYQTELAITSERLAEEEAQLHKERTRRMEELRLAERKRRAAAADHQSSVELLNMLTRGQEVTTFDDPEQVRAALQERLREYREGHGGDKFEDEQFKLRAKELGKTFSDHSLGVARGGTLTTKLFDPEPTPDEIKQGDLGDCYLLSAISVLADPTNPARVRNLFLTDQFNELGMYAAQFYHDGSWNAVVVDDNLPVKDDNFAFAQTRLRDRRALWVPLLEKCYAKYFRGYDRIEGGLVHECLVHLTGGTAVEIDIGSSIQGVGALDGMLFSQLLEYRKRGYLMGCGNPAGKQSQSGVANAQGIVQGHAYAILDVREVLGDSGEKLRMMKLKNPWADDSEWNGDWGDNSPLWTRRLEGLLGLERGDDGIFWMSFTDFVSQFRKIYICRIFDNVEAYSYDMRRGVWERDEENDRSTGARGDGAEPQRWLRKQITGQWKGKTAVGCPRNPNSHRNPHYLLRVDRDDTPVFLSLAEPAKIDPADYARKAFYVLKKGDGSAAVRISKFKKREVVSEKMTFPVRQREVSTEVRLEAGFSYTIFVTTYKPQEADFILTAYSPRDFELRPMPDDADQVS